MEGNGVEMDGNLVRVGGVVAIGGNVAAGAPVYGDPCCEGMRDTELGLRVRAAGFFFDFAFGPFPLNLLFPFPLPPFGGVIPMGNMSPLGPLGVPLGSSNLRSLQGDDNER